MEQKDISEDEYQLRLESQSESIRILTIHKSKGLEFLLSFSQDSLLPQVVTGMTSSITGKTESW